MKPNYNLWMEVNGEVVLSLWRVRLLEAIQETGSITHAAEKIGVPYRVAWQKIQEMEARLGEKLLETHAGGAQGGGSQLTPLALDYIARFNLFKDEVIGQVERSFKDHFSE